MKESRFHRVFLAHSIRKYRGEIVQVLNNKITVKSFYSVFIIKYVIM